MQNVVKPLPGDVDLELRLVAGTLDLDADDAGALLANVPNHAFGNRGLRAAWELMRQLAAAGALNSVAFAKECSDSVPDGVEVYRQIVLTVTGADRETLERWAELVKRLAHRRALVLRLDAALRTAWHSEESNPAEIEAALADAGRNDLAAFAPIRLPDIAEVAGRQAEYARGLVEAHGGTITAENGADGGARFTIRLPLGQPPIVPREGSE